MKKVLFFISLVLIAGTVSAQTFRLPAFQLNLVPHGNVFQGYVMNQALLNGARFVAGETYTVTFKFTLSRDVNSLWWTLVDNTPAAGWWRDIINAEGRVYENLRAGQEITITETIRISSSASTNSVEANSVCFSIRGGSSAPVMRFTEFSFRKH